MDVGWHWVAPIDIPDDGRVRSAVISGHSVALTRCGGVLGALENRCSHQGGPIGEGSIEKGMLRCPWHGYDYDPLTGQPPEGFSDAVVPYAIEERVDGVFVRLPGPRTPTRTVADALGKISKEQLAGDFPSGTPAWSPPTGPSMPGSAAPRDQLRPA